MASPLPSGCVLYGEEEGPLQGEVVQGRWQRAGEAWERAGLVRGLGRCQVTSGRDITGLSDHNMGHYS